MSLTFPEKCRIEDALLRMLDVSDARGVLLLDKHLIFDAVAEIIAARAAPPPSTMNESTSPKPGAPRSSEAGDRHAETE